MVNCVKCHKKRAYYNIIGNVPLYCFSCKEPNMVNTYTIKCVKCGITRPSYNKVGNSRPLYCLKCKDPEMINVISTLCIKCKKKQPTFNIIGEKKALYCKDCKENGMIDVLNKKCIICHNKRPTFNYISETRPLYCADCKLKDMISVSGRKCVKCNKKTAAYNKEGFRPLFCADCRELGMINIVEKKCIICHKKVPTFNYIGNRAQYCAECKKEGMINVRSSKCIKCHIKQPLFNKSGEKSALYCVNCKEIDMVEVRHRKCLFCNTIASYNIIGLSPEYCARHKLGGMVRFPRKRCHFKGCKEIATHGLLKVEYCEEHCPNEAKNFGLRECKSCHLCCLLNKDNLCEYCADNRIHVYEEDIKKYIIENCKSEDVKIDCDKIVDIACSKKRPDIVLDYGNRVIIIEIDENQHKSYLKSCELSRMTELSQAFINPSGFISIVWLRYNPNNYKIDNKLQKTSELRKKEKLIEWINFYRNKKFTEQQIIVKYLYYDNYDDRRYCLLKEGKLERHIRK